MRVALLTDGIWPYVLGGMQKHSYYLCKYLAQKKIYVDLFHFNRSTYNIESLEVFTDKERKYIRSEIVDMPRSIPFPGHYLYNSYRHSRAIFEIIKDRIAEYDFIYTKGFTGWYLIEQKAAQKIKAPPIGVKFHGYEMFQVAPDLKTLLQYKMLLRAPVKSISQKADVVFSYGGKITEIIRALKVDPEKIFEMPSGVENSVLSEEINPVDKKIRFLYLGRYERRKGIEELNKAVRAILSGITRDKLSFSFIGPIPKSKQLRNRYVRYYGEIRNKQKLQNLIRQHDVIVCPSWSEGLPNVILESMANGLAVVATDVGANRVVVSSANGWLLKSPNPEEIRKTIESIMELSSREINEKKMASLQVIRHFTWERLIDRFTGEILGVTSQ